MAREIVTLTHVWCDVCLRDGQQVEAEELPPVSIGKLKPRLLALCEPHRKELFDPFREVVSDLGQIVPSSVQLGLPGSTIASASDQGIWPCPDPDCEHHSQPYTHRQSLRNHAREKHGCTIPELEAKHGVPDAGAVGQPSALSLARMNEQPTAQQVDCPECGKVYRYPEYRQPTRALGVHRAKVHGVKGQGKVKAGKTQRKAS